MSALKDCSDCTPALADTSSVSATSSRTQLEGPADGSGAAIAAAAGPSQAVERPTDGQSETRAAAVPAASAPPSAGPIPTANQTQTPMAMVFPPPSYPALTIEFCDRCRWAPRATWIQTELFLTFPTPMIKRITLIPLVSPETGGRFRVWLELGPDIAGQTSRAAGAETVADEEGQEELGGGPHLVWDRKTEGGFPELKVLKQRIRNLISPEMGLGHSDKPGAEHKPFGQALGVAS